MKIVKNAQFVPGVCLVCGGSDSDRDWFLDIEKQAEFWGNIYFCNLCCGTMVYLFRCGNVTEYIERILELESLGEILMERAKRYESALDTISSVISHRSDEFAPILAHKNFSQPEPEFGVSTEPAGARLAEQTDDSEMGELPSFNFVSVRPDTDTGW